MYRPSPDRDLANLKPRPKSAPRYARRYKYPAARKTVFKNIRCYKYEARPATPKDYFPRPKSSNRYVFAGRPVIIAGPNPYQKRSVFKPAERYVCKSRETRVPTERTSNDKKQIFRFGVSIYLWEKSRPECPTVAKYSFFKVLIWFFICFVVL